MTDFSIKDGIAHIQSDTLANSWWTSTEYQEAVIGALGPTHTDDKRVVMTFEAKLGALMAAKSTGPELDALLKQYLSDDYRQHDPTVGQGREGLAQWLREVAVHFPGTPPPPVALIADGGLISVLLSLRLPHISDAFIVTAFRVRDGRLVEHWSSASP